MLAYTLCKPILVNYLCSFYKIDFCQYPVNIHGPLKMKWHGLRPADSLQTKHQQRLWLKK